MWILIIIIILGAVILHLCSWLGTLGVGPVHRHILFYEDKQFYNLINN